MKYIINGGRPLSGSVDIHGSKNSVLPILAASLLHRGKTTLHNVPDLLDVNTSLDILRHLGAGVTRDGPDVEIDASEIIRSDIPRELMHRMRSSVIFLGAVLARMGMTTLSLPGGCELGPRPIDLHLSSLSKMGDIIEGDAGCVGCEDLTLVCRHEGLFARDIVLPFPSVGATENIIIAACAAYGVTRIKNLAREPEITDLANYINSLGGSVRGAGERVIIIEGEMRLHDTVFTIPGDRIVAGTLLCAVAACGGEAELSGIEPGRVKLPIEILERAGCSIEPLENSIVISAKRRVRGMRRIETAPYPAFPTDLQPPFMALACLARGRTVFTENIFESRYAHAAQLVEMGARITEDGKQAVVREIRGLRPAELEAKDLRGGAALMVAALATKGCSKIGGVHHIERGYEKIEQTLSRLGADITRG